MAEDYITITVTEEVHHSVEIRAEDYVHGELTTAKLMDLWHDIKCNPKKFIAAAGNAADVEVGDIRHSLVTHELK